MEMVDLGADCSGIKDIDVIVEHLRTAIEVYYHVDLVSRMKVPCQNNCEFGPASGNGSSIPEGSQALV